MRFAAAALAAALVAAAPASADGGACSYRSSTPSAAGDSGVSRDSWLAGEHLRVGLDAPLRFMPAVVARNAGRPVVLARSASPLDAERLTAADPDGGATISLAALLDGRLYADGIVVLKGEQVALERYRPGFAPGTPRPLLHGTRPVLAALLAAASDRGRLSRDKSIATAIPDLAKQPNLRKASVQRLMEGRTGLVWSVDDRRLWAGMAGWIGTPPPGAQEGVRAWLKARRGWPRDASLALSDPGAPDAELMVWALERASGQPVSRVLCESLLPAIGAADEAYWFTDATGTELADGLALSLHDFARLGLALLASRSKPGGIAPKWLGEALAAGSRRDTALPGSIEGLGPDAAWRYRFVSLPEFHQAAIVGPFGNSLLVDFDRKLVVALYASVPRDYSELALRGLRSLWAAVTAVEAVAPSR